MVKVLLVVPEEKSFEVGLGVQQRPKAAGVVGLVFQGLELGFAEGVVVADVRTAVGLGHAQLGQELHHQLARHGRATVGVDGEGRRVDLTQGHGLIDELGREISVLALGHAPANDVAAEEVEHDVGVVKDPGLGTGELRYVPGPDLVGSRGAKEGSGVRTAAALQTTLLVLTPAGEVAVEGSYGSYIDTVMEELGVDLGGRLVDETVLMNEVTKLLDLRIGELTRAVAWQTRSRNGGRRGAAIESGAADAEGLAGCVHRDIGSQLFELVDHSVSKVGSVTDNSSETFFWRARSLRASSSCLVSLSF